MSKDTPSGTSTLYSVSDLSDVEVTWPTPTDPIALFEARQVLTDNECFPNKWFASDATTSIQKTFLELLLTDKTNVRPPQQFADTLTIRLVL